MSIVQIGDKCTGCSSCMQICPKQCITMQTDAEGFIMPKVDESLCVECGLCEKHCHVLQGPTPKSKIRAFYGWHKDEHIRVLSSSGGAYSALANIVLERGGVVFGAVYDKKKRKVIHTDSEQADFSGQRKSKYVESDLENSFFRAKQLLEDGREVLFSGTPCQIAGLYCFLGKKYPNLFTCDFFCHGVAPMSILNEHLAMLEKKYRSNVQEIDFRPKVRGWSTQCLQVFFENRKQYLSHYLMDSYFKGFIRENLFLRKSCYQCQYGEAHKSDIIMGDFWGFRAVKPMIKNDEKGISLLIANSERGNRLLNEITSVFELYPMDSSYADYAFKKVDKVSKYQKNRANFFESCHAIGFEKTTKKFYMPYPYFVRRLLHWLKRVLGTFRGVK